MNPPRVLADFQEMERQQQAQRAEQKRYVYEPSERDLLASIAKALERIAVALERDK